MNFLCSLITWMCFDNWFYGDVFVLKKCYNACSNGFVSVLIIHQFNVTFISKFIPYSLHCCDLILSAGFFVKELPLLGRRPVVILDVKMGCHKCKRTWKSRPFPKRMSLASLLFYLISNIPNYILYRKRVPLP